MLFGRYGVTGVVNVDLTPDFVARLGAAFGSVLPKGSTVTINRDPHRSPRMIKRALISGLPSAGNNVLDLRSLPIPVARYYTRAIKAAGGVHVRLSPYDPRVVDIRFMGPDGLNLTREQERAIERVFFREDYRRVYLDDIGNIEYADDAGECMPKGTCRRSTWQAIQSANFKVVVDYAHAPAADVLPDLLDAADGRRRAAQRPRRCDPALAGPGGIARRPRPAGAHRACAGQCLAWRATGCGRREALRGR